MCTATRYCALMMLPAVLSRPVVSQGENSLAIIPLFHDRQHTSGVESPLQLQHQKCIFFVYRDVVAVYAEAELVNTGMEPLLQELALPSRGHEQVGGEPET